MSVKFSSKAFIIKEMCVLPHPHPKINKFKTIKKKQNLSHVIAKFTEAGKDSHVAR